MGTTKRGLSNLPKMKWRNWSLNTEKGKQIKISLYFAFLVHSGLPAGALLLSLKVLTTVHSSFAVGSHGTMEPPVSRVQALKSHMWWVKGYGFLSINKRQSVTSLSRYVFFQDDS